MKRLTSFFITAFLIYAGFISAQTDANMEKEPGYFNFGDLSGLDDSESYKEAKINQDLFKLMSQMDDEKDPEVQKLFENIKLIHAQAFNTTAGNIEKVRAKIKEFDDKLIKEKWMRIVQVTGKSEGLNVYVKSKSEKEIYGVVVTVFNKEKESAFINVIGNIDMEALGKLSKKFDLPGFKDKHGMKDGSESSEAKTDKK